MALLMGAPDRGHRERIGSLACWLTILLPGAWTGTAAAQSAPSCPPIGALPGNAAEILEPVDPATPIEIASDHASLDVNGDATLEGKVEVHQGNRQLRAEGARYDASSSSFRVQGSIEYRDPLLIVRGRSGTYSATQGAAFDDAQFELPSRPARGTAGEISVAPDGRIGLERVTYSTCPAEDRAWQLRARAITLDTHSRTGTGRGTRVEFKGVPIVYLPWISFPLGNERKSGFLFPSVGHSGRSGLELSAPWYWNLAPNYDLTFEPALYSRRGVDLGGEFRWLGERQRGKLHVNYLPGDGIRHEDRSLARIDYASGLSRGWQVRISAAQVSDAEYFEDFGQGSASTSVVFVEQHAAVSYRDEHWLFRGEIQHFQTMDRTLPTADRPPARLPRLTASGEWNIGARELVTYGFDSELVNFDRSQGATGWRLDLAPRVGLDIDGPGFFLRPGADLQLMGYAIGHGAPGAPTSPGRAVPGASLDAGLIFERPSAKGGHGLWTLEPRMLYVYRPFRDQSALPIFDTALPDLNLVQLFRTNRYVGGDRVSDANQLSVGVTTRLIDAADGRQFLAATLGQAVYFEAPRVQLPGEAVRSRDTSDLIAQVALTAYRNWSVDLGMQWNPAEKTSERSQLLLQYRPATDRVVNVGYRQQRGQLEQAELSGAWPVSRRWNTFARAVYSLRDSKMIEQFAGFEYRACCWRLRTVARRFVSSRTGEQDTGIYLQLELTGLASVGIPADAFLEQAIRGYSPSIATN